MFYNVILLQVEIIALGMSILYIFYYLLQSFLGMFARLKQIVSIQKTSQDQVVAKVEVVEKPNLHLEQYSKNEVLTHENRQEIQELVKKIQLSISKADYTNAKNLIVKGLTIDKFNIELNAELASIYILEKDYHKAEYIYKDLLLIHKEEFEIIKKLSYVLTMQEKYSLAIEMYLRAYELKKDDIEIVNMLAHLYYYENYFDDSINFLRVFLRQNPRDAENLTLLGYCYKFTQKNHDAITTFYKVLDIQPYNEDIKAEIETLRESTPEE